MFDGQAMVQVNDNDVKVKGGHELEVNASKLKAHGFDKKAYESNDLYNWSSLRSAYVAEANADVAPTYIVAGGYGPGWVGAGWYWDPWFRCYTFLPGDGLFYSPFGWGFYSPFWAVRLGYYGGFGHYYHAFGGNPRTWGPAVRTAPALRAGHVNPSPTLRENPRGFGGVRGSSIHSVAIRGGCSGGLHPMFNGGFRGGAVGGLHGGTMHGGHGR